MFELLRIALADILASTKRVDLAGHLALENLKDRYRRSYIGLSWIILSFVAFVAIKGAVFTGLFASADYDYFSHLVIGFALFGFMTTILSGGANLYVTNRTWILSSNQPYTLYMHILLIGAMVELALLVIPTALLVTLFGAIEPAYIWTLPGAIIVYYLTGFGICLVFSPIGAKARDFVYAVQSVMRILFFATPIIWLPTPGTIRQTIAAWNPLTYYLDIVRIPVIEGRFPAESWLICLTMTALLLVAGLFAFGSSKRRVPLWL